MIPRMSSKYRMREMAMFATEESRLGTNKLKNGKDDLLLFRGHDYPRKSIGKSEKFNVLR